MPSPKGRLGRLLIQQEEKQERLNVVYTELTKLEKELSRLDAEIFVTEHNISEHWEIVPWDQWEHLEVGTKVEVAVLRPLDQDSWFLHNGVIVRRVEWDRHVESGDHIFNLVSPTGKPNRPEPGSGIHYYLWKETS